MAEVFRMSFAFWRNAARTAVVLGLTAVTLGAIAPAVRADEQRVHRLGLALSIMPTGLALGDVNSAIDELNRQTAALGPPFSAQAPIDPITWDGLWQAELKYFVTRKVAVIGGIGQIKKQSLLELQPVADGYTRINAYVRSVPIHLGADYYFEPRTSGDFTWRPFVGGGYVRVADTKVTGGYDLIRPDSTLSTIVTGTGTGHGFFVEAGTHFMFPSRYSILVNANYRHAKTGTMTDSETGEDFAIIPGEEFETDISGFGIRFALQIDLWGKPPE